MADRENAGLSEITHSRKRLAEKETILGKEGGFGPGCSVRTTRGPDTDT